MTDWESAAMWWLELPDSKVINQFLPSSLRVQFVAIAVDAAPRKT
jgi:hypothetical protein